ncbi:helix-turn-helix domain-containing protein [Chromohalobacter moromii]|uniref:HTH cro/C1-type domain-containing protein n=1 Tax=Chromohalobacter moromii TaxID=2860329 RepID=A0A9X3B528_9GAMM|nr:helix-turn-helix domain-containing protein [Chromohalobacter moromii]MCK2046987.1 hypothetical protein [Chromohalobacter moromii]MCT8506564.1 hypothetical protein [Chromohalobacter moromii]
MTTMELLERLKTANGAASDYRIAKILGVKPQTVSHWKNGRGTMGDEVGIRAAEALGLDPVKVIVDLHIEREEGNPTFSVWKALGRRLEMAAMPAVAGLVGYFASSGLPHSLV